MAETPKHPGVISRCFSAAFHITAGTCKGIGGLICHRFTGKPRFKVEEIVLYSAHASFYLWVLILEGWTISPLIWFNPMHAIFFTWLWVWTLFTTLVMLMFDLNTVKLLITGGSICLLYFFLRNVEVSHNVLIISSIVSYIRNLHPEMNGGLPSVISWLLFFPWIFSLLESFRSRRESFSPNSIEERRLFQGSHIFDRSNMHFEFDYPDLVQTLFGFGSGSIVALNAENKIVKRWDNLLFLFFKQKRLDEILHQRSAVVDNAKNDPVEAEVVNQK